MNRRPWTAEELAFLEKTFPLKGGPAVCAETLKRSMHSVYQQANLYGIYNVRTLKRADWKGVAA